MAIKIILPKGSGVKTSYGARFFADCGAEITGVIDCQVSIKPNSMITATITVEIDDIENLEGLVAEFPNQSLDFIGSEVEKHGYKLVKIEE